VREAHRLAESKDPYLATVAMGRQGILEYLGTLPECRETPRRAEGAVEMQGILRLRLAFRFAEVKSSLRMTSA
jgi:hypothetical protein